MSKWKTDTGLLLEKKAKTGHLTGNADEMYWTLGGTGWRGGGDGGGERVGVTMILTLPQLQGANLLTHSREACFKTCPRKHYFAYEMGIRPAHAANPLRMGSAFHLGLETLKAGGTADAAVKVVQGAYADTECPPWMEADEFAVEVETVLAMLRGYAMRWAGDLIVKYVAVEQSFDLPITNPATGGTSTVFHSGGKIDGIAELPDGKLAVMEHKFIGEDINPNADYWRRLLMDSQISRYYLAAHQMGYDVSTTIYDVTRKPAIRPKAIAKTDRALATSRQDYYGLVLNGTCPERETPRMYGARLLMDTIERRDFYFARMEIPRLESDLEDFRHEQWQIQQAIRAAQLNGRWYRNTSACLNMGKCPYFDICRQGTNTEQVPAGFRRVDALHEELAATKENA